MNNAKTSTVQPIPSNIKTHFYAKQAKISLRSSTKTTQTTRGDNSPKAVHGTRNIRKHQQSTLSSHVLLPAETPTTPATPQPANQARNTYRKSSTHNSNQQSVRGWIRNPMKLNRKKSISRQNSCTQLQRCLPAAEASFRRYFARKLTSTREKTCTISKQPRRAALTA